MTKTTGSPVHRASAASSEVLRRAGRLVSRPPVTTIFSRPEAPPDDSQVRRPMISPGGPK